MFLVVSLLPFSYDFAVCKLYLGVRFNKNRHFSRIIIFVVVVLCSEKPMLSIRIRFLRSGNKKMWQKIKSVIIVKHKTRFLYTGWPKLSPEIMQNVANFKPRKPHSYIQYGLKPSAWKCKNPQYSMKCVINVKYKNIIPIYRMAETESRNNATCRNFQASMKLSDPAVHRSSWFQTEK